MSFQYQPQRNVTDQNDCFFYHRMDLPETDTPATNWDLRDCINDYLGGVDFTGKRALDIGTASGYLSFEMEKRGADVVSFDMPSSDNWDVVPHYRYKKEQEQRRDSLRKGHERLQNAYWYAHKKLNSNAEVFYGDIYDLPVQMGNFDVVLMGMILGHVRDPFQAIYSASRLCRNTIIITNQTNRPRWWQVFKKNKRNGDAQFMPSGNQEILRAWWNLSIPCLDRMLSTVGFRIVKTIHCSPKCLVENRTGREHCTSIVAERFAGEAEGIGQYVASRAA